MKRLLGLILVILCIYAVYYDLTTGTLQSPDETTETETVLATIPYEEREVRAGDTVLSIIEREWGYPTGVSIEEVITDFMILNEGLDPMDIQIGRVYKFPVYNNEQKEF